MATLRRSLAWPGSILGELQIDATAIDDPAGDEESSSLLSAAAANVAMVDFCKREFVAMVDFCKRELTWAAFKIPPSGRARPGMK